MNKQENLQRLVDEFNDRAKAEGRYLDKDFWEIPRASGSILDVPETHESRARVASLRKRIAELRQAAMYDHVPLCEDQNEAVEAAPETQRSQRK